MTSLKVVLRKVISLEDQLAERLSIVLFGDQVEEDYKDIALPSEDRKVETERSRKKRKRRGIQLQLLLMRGLKKLLLRGVEGVEMAVLFFKTQRSRQVETGNTYIQ